MKVYEGLNEKTKDIIVDVLEKYCVPKRVEVVNTETFFGYYKTYNIHLDLREEPLKFIKQKVEERLNLEKSFDKKAVDPHEEINKEKTEKSAIVKEIDEHMENSLSNFWKKTLDNIFNNKSPKIVAKSVKDFIEEKQKEKEIEFRDVTPLLGNPLLDLLLAPMEMSGQEVKFDDLDEKEKEILLRKASLEDLRSKNCKIIKSPWGLSVQIEKRL